MESTTIEVRVRYAETDQMGRAHHAHHLIWCESARTEWLRSRGVSYARLEEEGIYLPVSKARIDYRGAVGYDETVRVEAWPSSVRSRALTFRYRLDRPSDGALLAEAETELVCTDGEGRVRRFPDRLRTVLGGEGPSG